MLLNGIDVSRAKKESKRSSRFFIKSRIMGYSDGLVGCDGCDLYIEYLLNGLAYWKLVLILKG